MISVVPMSSEDSPIAALRAIIFQTECTKVAAANAEVLHVLEVLKGLASGVIEPLPKLQFVELSSPLQWLVLQHCRLLPVPKVLELFPAVKQYRSSASTTDQLLSKALLLDPDSTQVHHLFGLSLQAESFTKLSESVSLNGLNRWAHDWASRDVFAEQALKDAEKRAKDIENSTIWQFSAPLRKLVVISVKIRRKLRMIPAVVRSEGGWCHWLKKAWQLGPVFGNRNYHRWAKRYDKVTERDRKRIEEEISKMPNTPVIAVVMPTYNPNVEWLSAAIESVQKQIYPHWKLYIADDASTDPAIADILSEAMSADSRIKVVFRQDNGHIAAATNSALSLVESDWVAFLDHDDLLAERALFEVAKVVIQQPSVRLIYSDEDKIDEKNNRRDPYFKPDWNYPLCLSHNLITHFAVYHKGMLDEVGGLRAGFDGAQDYDLVLRVIEHIQPSQIFHIPRVLYHWRVHSQSTAGSGAAKPYAMYAGQQAINQHFERIGINAFAEATKFGYRPRFALPDPAPKVSVIIPTRNAHQLVMQCLKSIWDLTIYPDYEIILVDNGSDDPAALQAFSDACKRYPIMHCIRDDGAFNFARLCNKGVTEASGEVICLLNNDIEVESPGWLEDLVAVACQPNFGAVSGKLLYPDNTIQHAGVILGVGGWAGHAHKGLPRDGLGYVGRAGLMSSFSAVTGACLVVRRDRFLAVNGLDETAFAVACNDVDFCLRLRAEGWQNVYVPWAVLYHHESATRGYEDTQEKKDRFQAEVSRMWSRWGKIMADDPAYNPNLSLVFEDFSLAWPPRQRER